MKKINFAFIILFLFSLPLIIFYQPWVNALPPTPRHASPEQLENWVSTYKLIVFRGYNTLPKQELALFGQKLGKPLQWAFGAINELKVKVDTENYIFTDHEVPLHWDGAFVGTAMKILNLDSKLIKHAFEIHNLAAKSF